MPSRHIGGEEVYLRSFLASAPDGSEWSTLSPSHFTPGKETFCPMNWRLDGPQRESGYFAPADNPVHRLVIPTALSRFSNLSETKK